MLPEPIQATYHIIQVFDKLNIPYFLGGSLASIVHGLVRTTQDANVIADIKLEHIDLFIAQVQDNFYIDQIRVKNAILNRESFNLIHRKSLFKVDIFISNNRPFENSQFKRARKYTILKEPTVQAMVTSAEDILLAKLDWYRQGGETSERQWQDVLGIGKVQGDSLDKEYLQYWANELDINHLLEKFFSEI